MIIKATLQVDYKYEVAKITTIALKYGFNISSKEAFWGHKIKIIGPAEKFSNFIETANYTLDSFSSGIRVIKYKYKKERKKKLKDSKYL